MTAPWLHVVGIGDDGLGGLAPAARALLLDAEAVVGGARHLGMLPGDHEAERLAWPSPWDAMLEALAARRGRRVRPWRVCTPTTWPKPGARSWRRWSGRAGWR